MQNYYSVYGGQQFSPYYPSNLYPFYSQYAQSSQNDGFGIQFPQMVQFPNFVHEQHHYASTSQGILSFPSSMPLPTPTTSSEASRVQPTKVGTSASSQASIASASEQNSSST
ncbi:RNA-binding protein 38-like isoform X1 [Senna tora]|uniref:RNA-binding protein 38-like isoform X1 n=1 Tax=Senna tora TaxID=362788 RepID=A0A835CI01_9FABA|nr:RNA-binding protein 38-like isoform X1 [Senna tora]